MIKILNSEFGHNALLLNGIIMGVKGFLSFLSAPLIGALSDVYGRKLFLLITAFFTCVPIPFIKVRSSCGSFVSWTKIRSVFGTQWRHPPFPLSCTNYFLLPRFTQSHILSSWL